MITSFAVLVFFFLFKVSEILQAVLIFFFFLRYVVEMGEKGEKS